ncbi:MAG: spore coat U domain-containing protein [Candidatus Binatia bacterium]
MTARRLRCVSIAVWMVLAVPGTVVAMECTIVGVSGVAFGGYDVFDASPRDSVGSLTYRCTNVQPGDAVRIELMSGVSGTVGSREMRQVSSSMGYNLYVDATRTAVWGDGTGGSSVYGPVTPPNDANVTVPVYGRIAPRQDVHVGMYDDLVTVTLIY